MERVIDCIVTELRRISDEEILESILYLLRKL